MEQALPFIADLWRERFDGAGSKAARVKRAAGASSIIYTCNIYIWPVAEIALATNLYSVTLTAPSAWPRSAIRTYFQR